VQEFFLLNCAKKEPKAFPAELCKKYFAELCKRLAKVFPAELCKKFSAELCKKLAKVFLLNCAKNEPKLYPAG